MSGIYIKGMEMPDCGYVCLKVYSNGEVLTTKEHRGALVITGIKEKVGTAVPVPPHGRLIDADALIDGLVSNHEVVIYATNAPTIIPAEEDE